MISANIDGTNCDPDRESLSFVSDKMFAITATVDDEVSGEDAEVLLNDAQMISNIGYYIHSEGTWHYRCKTDAIQDEFILNGLIPFNHLVLNHGNQCEEASE